MSKPKTKAESIAKFELDESGNPVYECNGNKGNRNSKRYWKKQLSKARRKKTTAYQHSKDLGGIENEYQY